MLSLLVATVVASAPSSAPAVPAPAPDDRAPARERAIGVRADTGWPFSEDGAPDVTLVGQWALTDVVTVTGEVGAQVRASTLTVDEVSLDAKSASLDVHAGIGALAWLPVTDTVRLAPFATVSASARGSQRDEISDALADSAAWTTSLAATVRAGALCALDVGPVQLQLGATLAEASARASHDQRTAADMSPLASQALHVGAHARLRPRFALLYRF